MSVEKAVSNTEIEIPCDCGRAVKLALGSIRGTQRVKCACGVTHEIDASQSTAGIAGLKREAKSVDDALDKLDGMGLGG